MAKKIIVANWKMNSSFDEADQWIESFADFYYSSWEELQNVEIVVCPPYLFLDHVDGLLLENVVDEFEKIMLEQNKKADDFSENEMLDIAKEHRYFWLGAQDCHYENSGSFTGDIGAEMVKNIGADFVILGHSERRENHFEGDDLVAKKVSAALSQNLVPIICVGENKETRDQKKHVEFVYKQLLFSIPKGIKFDRLIIAYEPIWSIGTGVLPSDEEISEMVNLIHKIIAEKGQDFANSFSVLYGGSVNEKNAKEILAIKNVDGLLVGKASLDVKAFAQICLS